MSDGGFYTEETGMVANFEGSQNTATEDYIKLVNKPQIEGVTLEGNKTAEELGLAKAADIPEALADLQDDETHRTVSDEEKAGWNAKTDADDLQDALAAFYLSICPTVNLSGRIAKETGGVAGAIGGPVGITVPFFQSGEGDPTPAAPRPLSYYEELYITLRGDNLSLWNDMGPRDLTDDNLRKAYPIFVKDYQYATRKNDFITFFIPIKPNTVYSYANGALCDQLPNEVKSPRDIVYTSLSLSQSTFNSENHKYFAVSTRLSGNPRTDWKNMWLYENNKGSANRFKEIVGDIYKISFNRPIAAAEVEVDGTTVTVSSHKAAVSMNDLEFTSWLWSWDGSGYAQAALPAACADITEALCSGLKNVNGWSASDDNCFFINYDGTIAVHINGVTTTGTIEEVNARLHGSAYKNITFAFPTTDAVTATIDKAIPENADLNTYTLSAVDAEFVNIPFKKGIEKAVEELLTE